MNFSMLFKMTLVAGVAMTALAGMAHELLFPAFFAQETESHQGTVIIFFAYLILAGLMSYIFLRIHPNGTTLMEGALLGMLIGVLWVFPHQLTMAAAHGDPLGYVFINGLWHMVEQGFGGVVITYLYSRVPTN